MEMVAAAKSKKMVDCFNATRPYQNKLSKLMSILLHAQNTQQGMQMQDKSLSSPYLRKSAKIRNLALIVVTANRGLCGGYNSNLLRLAYKHYQKASAEGIACDLHVIGKKGLSYFKFLKLPIKASYLNVDDNLKYPEAEKLVLHFMEAFSQRSYDHVEIVATRYYSAAKQKPVIQTLLPLDLNAVNKSTTAENVIDNNTNHNYIFEPDLSRILKHTLPLSIKVNFYSVLLGALASEQILRRIAMKNATDAAEEMLKLLNRSYNRARQASITQELAEIVSGADAL